MKCTLNAVILSALVALVYSLPVPLRKRDIDPTLAMTIVNRDAPLVDPGLVPEFGVQAGTNPDGTGNCDGIKNPQGQVVKIPCSCPPDRNAFIQQLSNNAAAGHAINNPGIAVTFSNDAADQSNPTKIARIQAAIVTLQNLNGPGVGCPAASTTFSSQLAAVQG